MSSKSVVAGVVLIVGLLGVGGALAWWKYSKMQGGGPPMQMPPEFVDVAPVESVTWQPRARLVGTVVAKRAVTLSNEITGVVTEVGFDSGETLEPGHVLLKLDTSTEEADLAAEQAAERLSLAAIEEARARIRAAEAGLTLARSNFQRFKSAAESKSVAASELDRAGADLEQALAELEREKSSLSRVQAELEQARARAQQIHTLIAKKTLKSPFRARAGMRTIHPGQYLAEGASIVSLTELTDDIYVDFAVPQEYAARVQAGTVVIASSAVLGGKAVPITVVSVDATVNPTTRNVRVRSSVANPGYLLKPGMFIDVEVPVDVASQFVAIPMTSVRRAAFGDHVFVLNPGDPAKDPPGAMRAQQRMVALGATVNGKVIVTSGLAQGEKVAAGGSFKLREGALVMEAPPADPAAVRTTSGD